MEASWYEKIDNKRVRCHLCPHECRIAPGKRGRCRVRENRDGTLTALTYGRASSVSMDPIEKKPLYHFHPGARILSVGSWGCNLTCAFCQNYQISQHETPTEALPPGDAVAAARARGSVGIAYTYNEPFIMAEYLRDCGRAAREAGLKNVLVTNGFVNPEPLEELLPLIDAMNVDIKAFREGFYEDLCGARLAPVLRTVERAARDCHVELTTLVIPGHNDTPKELEDEAAWIAEHAGRSTPVHLSAYFPRYKLQAEPTREETLRHARAIFRKRLDYVYLGNCAAGEAADTVCASCGAALVRRSGYDVSIERMRPDGACAECGAAASIVTD